VARLDGGHQAAGQRRVTVSMITHRMASEHVPVSERPIRRWLAEDVEARARRTRVTP
jgi:hypothetical protein